MAGVLAHTTILWLKGIVGIGRLSTSATVIDVRRLSIAQIDVFKGFLLALFSLLHLDLLCSSFVKDSHGPLAPTHSKVHATVLDVRKAKIGKEVLLLD